MSNGTMVLLELLAVVIGWLALGSALAYMVMTTVVVEVDLLHGPLRPFDRHVEIALYAAVVVPLLAVGSVICVKLWKDSRRKGLSAFEAAQERRLLRRVAACLVLLVLAGHFSVALMAPHVAAWAREALQRGLF